SDDDYKGVCSPPSKYFFGFMDNFEQAELKSPDPDCVIYSIIKFFNLAVNSANPNLLEMLFIRPEHQLYIHPLFQSVLDNRDLFLSKKMCHSFGRFAFAQMKRLKLHREWMMNPVEQPPTRADFGLPDKPEIGKENLEA